MKTLTVDGIFGRIDQEVKVELTLKVNPIPKLNKQLTSTHKDIITKTHVDVYA